MGVISKCFRLEWECFIGENWAVEVTVYDNLGSLGNVEEGNTKGTSLLLAESLPSPMQVFLIIRILKTRLSETHIRWDLQTDDMENVVVPLEIYPQMPNLTCFGYIIVHNSSVNIKKI